MTQKIYVTQGTNRHVIKRIDSTSKTVDASFGVFGTLGTDNGSLNFPKGICLDSSNNVYIADRYNHRIVKLDSALNFIAVYSVITTIFEPLLLHFDGANIIIVGNKVNHLMVGKMNTSGVMAYANAVGTYIDVPMSITPATAANTFAITGVENNLLLTVDDTTSAFSTAVIQNITGQEDIKYTGGRRVGTDFFLNSGRKIMKVDSTYENNGDSDQISKPTLIIAPGKTSTLLVFDPKDRTILRYNQKMNFNETVFTDTGFAIETDAYDICDIVEADV